MTNDSAKRIDESARILWAAFVALWFAFWLGTIITGCSDAAKRDAANFFKVAATCGKSAAVGTIAEAAKALANSVAVAISGGNGFDSDAWKNTGTSLLATFGADAVACASSQLFAKSQTVNSRNEVSSDGGVPHGALFASSLPSTSPEQSPYFKAIFDMTAGKK